MKINLLEILKSFIILCTHAEDVVEFVEFVMESWLNVVNYQLAVAISDLDMIVFVWASMRISLPPHKMVDRHTCLHNPVQFSLCDSFDM